MEILNIQKFKTTEDLVSLTETLHKKGLEIIRLKNPKYGSLEEEDALANFRDLGLIGIVARINDKVQRLKNHALGKNVTLTSEDIYDTVVDLMNYAAIFAAYDLDLKA